MDKNDPETGPIKRPKKFPKNRAARGAAKAAAGAVPYAGSTLAELADALLPNHEASDRSRWEEDVTAGVNELHGRVEEIDQRTGTRTTTLEGPPALVAKLMIERCEDGLAHDLVSIADVQSAYPDLQKDELEDAFGDLEALGLVESTHFIGSPSRYHLTQTGYEKLDEPILGWNTVQDARAIAALVVKKRENVRTSDLEAELGWPRRRLNPALRIVVDFVDPGRVSQSLQPNYVTTYFSPSNGELAQLRRFAAGE